MPKYTIKNKAPKIWQEDIQGFDPWNLSKDFYFDSTVANRVCKFFPDFLKHSKGEHAGKKFNLQKWQKKYIGHLFGWKRKSDNLRRFRTSLLYIPKKNGKTQLASGIGLLMLCADNEPGAEIYAAAADTEQAKIVYSAAAEMIEQNKILSNKIKIYRGYKALEFPSTKSYWKVLSSESRTKHGPNVHCLLVDELHVQKNNELIETLTAGVVARRQPLVIYMTTADHAGSSICNEEHDYAKRVRDGDLKDTEYLPCIYEAFEDDDWKNPDVWKKANPNLGITLPKNYFKKLVQKAAEKPSEENKFKRLHLNIQTKTAERWLNMLNYEKCGDENLKISDLDGEKCFAGLDLSSSVDITALSLFFPEQCAIVPFFWVPAKTAEKKIEYEIWNQDNFVEITDGETINYQWIRKKINSLSKKYQIADIAYDPWNASQIAIQLTDDDGLPMIEFRQGFKSMNEPSKEIEKLIIEGKITHFNNPVLKWMFSNCSVKEDPAGNIKPIKPSRKSALKIDGAVATIMAVGLAIGRESVKESENVYNSRGLIEL